MIKTFVLDVNKLPDPKEFPEVLFELEEKRREKIQKCRKEEDRKQSLGAGILLKKCLDERGINVSDIYYGEHGKPEVEGCFFSISHSKGMVVCAIGDAPVGCDIEKKGRYREGLAERFFTENEISYLNQFDEVRKKEEFLRIWTMKESYLKMTGEGLTFPLDRIEFELGDKVKVRRDGKECDCYLKEYNLKDYRITICSMEDKFENLNIV